MSAGTSLELVNGQSILRIGPIQGGEEQGSGFEIGMATKHTGGPLMNAPTNNTITTINQNTFITLQNK